MPTIDADAHVIETDRTWEYMDGPDRQFKPLTVAASDEDASEREFWLIDGRLHPKTQNIGKDTSKASREMEDIEARLKHMDKLEVDIQVLYPSLFLRPITNRPEVELALCKSYNRWLVDIWKSGKGRLRWAAVLPVLSMDKAVVECRWAKENGACAIFMRGVEGDKRLTDPYFYPLYEEAAKLDIPVCVHASAGNFVMHDFFAQESGFSKFKLTVVGAFHSVVFEGIPEKFARLRFGFIEVSAQWVPYAIHDLARRLEKRGRRLGKEVLRANRIYVACQTDDDLPYILTYAGEDNLVIGSDYGHADTASEIAALRVLKDKGDVGPNVIKKILDDNPRALYGL